MNPDKLNRFLGILPLITGLTGMSSIIYMNGVRGIGIGTFWIAGLMAIGIAIFGFMFMFGIGMISSNVNKANLEMKDE